MKPYLGVCLVLITIGGLVLLGLRTCQQAGVATVNAVRAAFADVLHVQPEISVQTRVIYAQTVPIAEFAAVSKDELVALELDEHKAWFNITIPLTTQTLRAESVYRVKAGFDLRQPYRVAIDPATHAVIAQMPPATILSVEAIGPLTVNGQSALLNQITDAERNDLLEQLQKTARAQATASGLVKEAENQVQARLTQLLAKNGTSLEIEWQPTPPPAPAPVMAP